MTAQLKPVLYATITGHKDKWVVSAGPIHVGTYNEYCVAAQECESFNRKRAGKPAMMVCGSRPRVTGGATKHNNTIMRNHQG